MNCKAAWFEAGTALHTFQDKYSHTNGSWMPYSSFEHGGTIANGGRLILPTAIPYIMTRKWMLRDDPNMNSARYTQAKKATISKLRPLLEAADIKSSIGKCGDCIEEF